MPETLSAADVDGLTSAATLLLSPLDFETVDEWRGAAIGALRELLGADSAGFLLPVTHGLTLFSHEHDPAALAAFPDLIPPGLSDGTPIWARAIQLGVTTLREGYGDDFTEYLKSPYHNEFVTPNQAFDTISSTCSLGGLDPRSAASLHFWHAHPTRRVFGERETTLLRLLRPAFLAGVRTELAWRSAFADLLETLDALQVPALIGDTAGAEIHQTPALDAVLRDEPERDLVRRAMLDLLSRARTMGKGGAEACARAATREVDTRGARYRLWACLHARSRAAARPLVVVSLEPARFSGCSHEALRERFGLTAAELRVCLLLARGRSNAEVARELFISPHTAKRHTERVLQKLGARSRAEVAARLLGVPLGNPAK